MKIFRNFKEKPGGLDVGFQAEGLSGVVLLGVRGQGGIGFFDWETGALVRRIEVDPKSVCPLTYTILLTRDLMLRSRSTGQKAESSSH